MKSAAVISVMAEREPMDTSTDPAKNVTYRTLYIDLNGVLDEYAGWTGKMEQYPLRPGARNFLTILKAQGYQLVLFTATDEALARKFVDDNDLGVFFDKITNVKGPAIAYIDDRAICFRGDYAETLQAIQDFRVHWVRGERIA